MPLIKSKIGREQKAANTPVDVGLQESGRGGETSGGTRAGPKREDRG